MARWGRVDGITAYSVGTTVCNAGDQPAMWQLNTNEHPVVAQHLYRLKDGRFEQIGMSWVAHAFFALNGWLCYEDCVPGGGSELAPHCSDGHSANLNGLQANLGPRWQVNAYTGYFMYPWSAPAYPATIGRRLQVRDADLHPPDNAGALYFIEGHYVSADEAAVGNHYDNATYRQVQVDWEEVHPTTYHITEVPGEVAAPGRPAVLAWGDLDPAVTTTYLDVPSDGRFYLAYKVTDLGGGEYRYEYALYNMNSDRAGRSFAVPVPVGVNVSTTGFHDIAYHSGNPYDDDDWSSELAGDVLSWESPAGGTKGNAVRWGTTYNFRFDADAPPSAVDATVVLLKSGTPASVTLPTLGPVPLTGADCNTNGIDDALDIFVGTSADCDRTAIPDECEIDGGTSLDCSGNGVPDHCEPDCNTNAQPDDCDILGGTSLDCDANGTPDECAEDCNENGTPDACDIATAVSDDCDTNGIPDECSLVSGAATDCNSNGTLDVCDLTIGGSFDCNRNALPDECDIAAGTSTDCNSNAIPDSCDISGTTSDDCNVNDVPDDCESAADCNGNTLPDICDIYAGTSRDCNANTVPDECDISGATSTDCNVNQTPDDCDIAAGTATDCNTNAFPDVCDLAGATSQDCNTNATPDECETAADCNTNGVRDICDVAVGTSADCNGNEVPDECESAADCNANLARDICDIAAGTSADCNANAIPDECDLTSGTSLDCNTNGTPDECERDCNHNDVPDDCDIAGATSPDFNVNGIPDECETGAPTMSEWGLIIMALLFLNAGTLVIYRQQPLVAGASKGLWPVPVGLPLDGRILVKVLAAGLGIALVALIATGCVSGSLTLADTVGTLLSLPLAAYLVHVWIMLRDRSNL
ncbi:MAG: hypothetical protein GY842_02370 [bacterium]|nr:hypothetical protein [bacterium]